MKKLEEIKEILIKHGKELKDKYKIKEIGIFGSYAKEEPKEESDLDMIVEFEEEESIGSFEFIGLMIDLEEHLKKKLGIKVHLASKRQAIDSDKWNYIKNDLIYLRGSRGTNKKGVWVQE